MRTKGQARKGKARGKGNKAAQAQAKPAKKKSLANQIRDVKRVLGRKELPDDVRAKNEALLADLEKKVEDRQRVDKEKKMALRYRKIKFVDRQKITRQLNAAQRRVRDAGADEKAAAEAELKELSVKFFYTKHFPKTCKYITLFPPAGESEKTAAKRASVLAAMREKVEASTTPDDLDFNDSEPDDAHSDAGDDEDDFFLPEE